MSVHLPQSFSLPTTTIFKGKKNVCELERESFSFLAVGIACTRGHGERSKCEQVLGYLRSEVSVDDFQRTNLQKEFWQQGAMLRPRISRPRVFLFDFFTADDDHL